MITEYTLENAQQWDKIVRSFAGYDVYSLSGYVKAFKIHGDGEPVLIYFENKDTRAINIVIKRDISECPYISHLEKDRYFDFTTPYGYGGWLVEGESTDELQTEYTELARKNNVVSEFVRFNPLSENYKSVENIYDVVRLGATVCIDTSDTDVVWQNMSSKNRNKIRKAQKNDISVYWGRDDSMIDDFTDIYNATMDKDRADAYYYFKREFYESILNDLKHNAMWFYAKKDSKIIAMAIFIFANGNMHYHLSGSLKEYQSLAPTNLILYEAALWAAYNGYGRLHLGGGVGAMEDSLYKFKKAFNRGDDTEFCIGKKVFMPDVYDELVAHRSANDPDFDVNTGFFPKYRG